MYIVPDCLLIFKSIVDLYFSKLLLGNLASEKFILKWTNVEDKRLLNLFFADLESHIFFILFISM